MSHQQKLDDITDKNKSKVGEVVKVVPLSMNDKIDDILTFKTRTYNSVHRAQSEK